MLISQEVAGVPKTRRTTLDVLSDFLDSGPSVNYEVLSGDKTLSIDSPRNQYLDPDTHRSVTLDASCEVLGTVFHIHNTGGTGFNLQIRDSAAVLIKFITHFSDAQVVWDGAAWIISECTNAVRAGLDTYYGYLSEGDTYLCAIQSIVVKINTTSVGITGTGTILSIIHSSGTGSPKMAFYQTATEKAYIEYQNGSTWLHLASDGPIGFSPANGSAGAFHADGSFTVGTLTSDNQCIGGFASASLAMIIPEATSTTVTGLTPSNPALASSSDEQKLWVFNGGVWRYATLT